MPTTKKRVYNLPLETEHWDYLETQQKAGVSFAWTLRKALEHQMDEQGAQLPPGNLIKPIQHGSK